MDKHYRASRQPSIKRPTSTKPIAAKGCEISKATEIVARLAAARAEIERIIDGIEALAPGAFHRTNTGDSATTIPLHRTRKG